MELKKKLSAKTIVGKVKPLLPKNDKGEIINESPVALMRVYGICNGIKSGVSTFGEWIAFTGNFKAIRLSDGEVFAGGQLFVPDVVTELLGPVVRAAQGADVEFAFDIGAQGTETEVGYEYMVNPLMKSRKARRCWLWKRVLTLRHSRPRQARPLLPRKRRRAKARSKSTASKRPRLGGAFSRRKYHVKKL